MTAYYCLASSWSVRKPRMPSEYLESSSLNCPSSSSRSFFFTPILRHISWGGPGLG